MGVPVEWLREDGKAGSVDLAVLALPKDDWARPEHVSFKTVGGLWYRLTPLEDTTVTDDGQLEPVNLSFDPRARWNGGPIEETGLALSYVYNWVLERRHFRIGAVSVANAVIQEGDRLVIDGHSTSPVDVAWSYERVDPSSGVKATFSMGRRLPTGEYVSQGFKSFAHF